ncbi:MAG: TetR family transcriptional regulator [Rhizobiales bacterium]|nr:TetR family transcriptional regulator [Hyphomicrobiales bacterium]
MPKIIDHDIRRLEIVEASWQVIASEGLEGLTMRKIAKVAGCTTGRLTHYFANREELVLAALHAAYDAAGDRMLQARAREGSALDRLLAMLEETLPLDEERVKEWKIWIGFWGVAMNDNPLAIENDARHTRWREALLPLLESINPALDATYEADRLIGIVDGLGLQAAIHPTPENLTRVREVLARQIAALGRS